MLGPQFDQLPLPGMGRGGAEQMTLFRTQSLGDGTTRGAFNTSPMAEDWVESKANRSVKPEDFGAPEQRTVVPTIYGNQERVTPAQFAPPENRFEFAERENMEGTGMAGELVSGGRSHLNTLRKNDEFWSAFSAGTDFGDNKVRAKPYDFRELRVDDEDTGYNGGNFAVFTPDDEQVVGLTYEESELPYSRVITGAGTGSAFAGHGYGKQAAMLMAIQNNGDGRFVHGNSFTPAGSANFEQNGALSESSIEDLVYNKMQERSEGWADDQMTEALWDLDDEDLALDLGVELDDEFDREAAEQRWREDHSYDYQQAAEDSYELQDEAKLDVQGALLTQQEKMLAPARPYFGLNNSVSGYREPVRSARMFDEAGSTQATSDPFRYHPDAGVGVSSEETMLGSPSWKYNRETNQSEEVREPLRPGRGRAPTPPVVGNAMRRRAVARGEISPYATTQEYLANEARRSGGGTLKLDSSGPMRGAGDLGTRTVPQNDESVTEGNDYLQRTGQGMV